MPSRFGNGRGAESAAPPSLAVGERPRGDATTESDYDSDGTASDAAEAPAIAHRTAAYRQVERTRSRSLSPPPTDHTTTRQELLVPSTPGASCVSADDMLTSVQALHSVYSSPTGVEEDETEKNVAVV